MVTLGGLFSAALDDIGRNFDRDALIERVDMMSDIEAASPIYPRLRFGCPVNASR